MDEDAKVKVRGAANLTGTAGEHYVAYKLSCLGLIAALPRGGAMGIDVLVSNADESRILAIQVKTTEWATRTKGRGDRKAPFELQFPLGLKASKLDNPNLIFAFVDLRGIRDETMPDVYLVPSSVVAAHCRPWADHVKWVRFQIGIDQLAGFKNDWNLVKMALDV